MKNAVKFIITLTMVAITLFSCNVFAVRNDDQIEIYKIGDTALTIKWTPYTVGGQTVNKYTVGYKIHGAAAYTSIDIDPTNQSLDYNQSNNEFSKRINNLSSNTIYDIKIDVYAGGDPDPITYYTPIMAMTKTVIDKSVQTIANPYGNDTAGHIDFAFTAPNEEAGGNAVSVDAANITGYSLTVGSSQSQIYSSGQPYKVLYNGISGKYDIYRTTTVDTPLTYNETQFSFDPQDQNGKDLLAFALYKTNQPSTDNFSLATVYYVIVKPIFKIGTAYENVITDATAKFETIENISTLLPLTITQISNDLIKLQFESAGGSSVNYDIYKGRLANSLVKIHREYDDGSRVTIQYFNKLEDPLENDIYYFKVIGSNGVASKVVSITISLNPNVAPVISNIQVEKIITDTVNNYSDFIISWDKPSNEDANRDNLNYRIYLNTDSSNQVYESDVVYDESNNIQLDLDGNIVLNTKKDINNNNILYNGFPVVFERICEINVSNLSDPATVYMGNTPLENFLNTGCNYYRITRNGQQIIRTMYRIRGQSFLTNADAPQLNGESHLIYNSNLEGELATDYKEGIKLNTTYYFKFDTYNSSNSQISDYSLTSSFTTPTDTVDTVTSPANLEAETIETNRIDLIWDPINASQYNDADVTYELYISENGSYASEDFYRIKNPTITIVGGKKHVTLDNYTLDDDAAKAISPNTIYLFKVRAIWATKDSKGNDVSINSNLSEVLPVTTKRTTISNPDMTTPPAPVDFQVTNVTSKSANLTWTKVDEFSTYRIVRTLEPIDAFATLIQTGDGVITGFTLSGSTYTYTDAALTANTLYYISIRSETVTDTVDGNGNPVELLLSSTWITVPVTTILVEAPTDITLVSRTATGHSVTINWKGKASLNYESAKKEDGTKNYVISEKATGESGNANIKTFELTLTGLKSNTKYLIKVRAKDPVGNMYSKYCEPIEVRTEFSQTDYNNDLEDKEEVEIITNDGDEWLKSPVEEIGVDSKKYELWVKQEKMADQIVNSSNNYYRIFLNQKSDVSSKIVNLPFDVISTLNQTNKILEVNTGNGILYIKPDILDNEALSELISSTDVKSRMLMIQINDLTRAERAAIINTKDYFASDASNISFKVIAYNKTEQELNTLITQKINEIINEQAVYVGVKTIETIRIQASDSIKQQIKRIISNACVSSTTIGLNGKKIKLLYNLNFDESGKINKYAAVIRNGNIQKEYQGTLVDNKFQFETDTLGTIAIIGKISAADIDDCIVQGDISILLSKYDFSNQIIDGKFRPEEAAKKEDTIILMVDILEPLGQEYEGLTGVEKAKKIGLAEGFPLWGLRDEIKREELAYLLFKLYKIETGIDLSSVLQENIYLADNDSISDKYKDGVQSILNCGIMSTYSNKYFYPSRGVTRAEVMTSLASLLRETGKIN